MDHLRIIASQYIFSRIRFVTEHQLTRLVQELCESVYHLAQEIMKDGGVVVCKLWQGALTNSEQTLYSITPMATSTVYEFQLSSLS